MPAQKRPQESTNSPPAQPRREEEEEMDDDSQQLNQNQNGEQAHEPDDSDGSSSSSDEYKEDDKDDNQAEYITVKLSDIRKEVQCPICLGVIRKTRTVMECLHRFCRECIDKSMRLGNNECPACRTHCASRRSLRDDPNYDKIIAYLYPDIDKYEEEELAFHEEEKARNKQIQASIAQTLRRQSEALGRKRSARATAAAFVRRSHGNYRNARGRRNSRNAGHQGSDEEEDANGNDGGKDSSSADERGHEVKAKRCRRWGGARVSQPSAAADSDAGYEENDFEVNRELLGASAGLGGSSDNLAWGKGGMRSHTRHGAPSAGNGRLPRNSRLSKLMDCLRCSDENMNELDVSLMLVSHYEKDIPNLQRPYLCCKPNLTIGQLCQVNYGLPSNCYSSFYLLTPIIMVWITQHMDCFEMWLSKQYVALQTSMPTGEVQIWAKRGPQESEPPIATAVSDKSQVFPLEENQTLGEIHDKFSYNQGSLVLAYGRK
ncbi:hypothetical protein M9H77_25925 [Catharanthus roseus]|uniref:Uncharacterized protein n=1 Tax=Catharanthus roseus TaxID=4058 RepID=A0ACC0A882_CATRO|nr:hypothetical protein M9H77_25925 [Catharanthus roseus]